MTEPNQPSLTSFSLSSWKLMVEFDVAEAISAAAEGKLGSETWAQGRAGLEKAEQAARELHASLKKALDAAKAAVERGRADHDREEAAKKQAFNVNARHPGMPSTDDAPSADAESPVAHALAQSLLSRKAQRLEALLSQGSLHAGLALARLDPADRRAALAVLRAAREAVGAPAASDALSQVAFAPLSPTLALLPTLGQAAVAEPVVPGGAIALRAGKAMGVFASEGDPAARAKREENARFGFAPGIGDEAGSFDHIWRGFARSTDAQSKEETSAAEEMAKRAVARALGLGPLGLRQFSNATGFLAAEADLAKDWLNDELPESIDGQAWLLAKKGAELVRRDSDSGARAQMRLRFGRIEAFGSLEKPVSWALNAADLLSAVSGQEMPSFFAEESALDRLPPAFRGWLTGGEWAEGGTVDLSSLPEWEREAFRPRGVEIAQGFPDAYWRDQRARQDAVEVFSAQSSAIAEAFRAARVLSQESIVADKNWKIDVSTASGAAGDRVIERQKAWLRESGAENTVDLAQRVFGPGSLSTAQLARVARSPKAFEQALAECGAPGRLAAGLSETLGVAPVGLESGNALCALARDAWIAQGGSAAGWRLLGQMPEAMVGALVTSANNRPQQADKPAPNTWTTNLLAETMGAAEACASAHLPAERLAMALTLLRAWTIEGSQLKPHMIGSLSSEHRQRVEDTLAHEERQAREEFGYVDHASETGVFLARAQTTMSHGGAFRGDRRSPAEIAWENWTAESWVREGNVASRNVLRLVIEGPEHYAAPEDEEQANAQAAEKQARVERAPFVVRDLLDRVGKTGALRYGPMAENPAGEKLVNEEMRSVLDFLKAAEPGVWQSFPAKPQWPLLARRAKEWHELVLLREDEARGKKQWAPLFGEQADGEYKAVELVNGAQLHAEGKRMHHCVSTYADQCARGECRIFAIEKNGQAHSTLELSWQPGNEPQWSAGQNLGYCNARQIDPAAIALGQKLAAKANELGLRPQTVEEAEAAAKARAEEADSIATGVESGVELGESANSGASGHDAQGLSGQGGPMPAVEGLGAADAQAGLDAMLARRALRDDAQQADATEPAQHRAGRGR